VRRISCKAFLCWFGSACRLVSAETFAAAFYPHVPRDLNQRRNATYSRSLTRITMPYCCHHWNRARHPYGYGQQEEEIFPLGAGMPNARVYGLGWSNTAQTQSRIVLTCLGRHWRSDHD
jgi:hypothetical protein